jgi:hypothetical protein
VIEAAPALMEEAALFGELPVFPSEFQLEAMPP